MSSRIMKCGLLVNLAVLITPLKLLGASGPSLSSPGAVPIVAISTNGLVVDSVTARPLAGVQVTVRDAVDNGEECGPPRVIVATTDSLGMYTVPIRCRATLEYAKPGYRAKTLKWPAQLEVGLRFQTSPLRVLDQPESGCCPKIRPVELVTEAKVK